MGKGFKINHAAIRQMTREIQSSFDRQAITIPVTVETGGIMAANDIEQWERLLVRALSAHRAVGTTSAVKPRELALDLTAEELAQAIQLALDDGFVESANLAGDLYLTPEGRRLLRRSPAAPSPTVVHNDFSGATISASNIATGDHNTQTANSSSVDVDALGELLRQAVELIDRSLLGGDELEDLDADIELIELQISDPSSRKKGVKRALRNIEQFAIASAGGATATGISQLVALLASQV